jgi:hypothetical protein
MDEIAGWDSDGDRGNGGGGYRQVKTQTQSLGGEDFLPLPTIYSPNYSSGVQIEINVPSMLRT